MLNLKKTAKPLVDEEYNTMWDIATDDKNQIIKCVKNIYVMQQTEVIYPDCADRDLCHEEIEKLKNKLLHRMGAYDAAVVELKHYYNLTNAEGRRILEGKQNDVKPAFKSSHEVVSETMRYEILKLW